MSRKIWVLTEERPKPEVIHQILRLTLKKLGIAGFIDSVRILPRSKANGDFNFQYQILGLSSPVIDQVELRLVSGSSSFVDYLVYVQDDEPQPSDVPVLAIEETKTDDSESRNTGVYQRATKFVYIESFYPDVEKIMLYHLKREQSQQATDTNMFGTRCLLTLGVKTAGKKAEKIPAVPFGSIKELIDAKGAMRKPPKGNVPIDITFDETSNQIFVSGRLVKSGSLSHDPNIGALSLIAATLRKLGWAGRITFTQHGLTQKMLRGRNKFIQICDTLQLDLDGLALPKAVSPPTYWHYESSGEKVGTIFLHLLVEGFSEGYSIYENHAGCERGYFYNAAGDPITVSKRRVDSNGKMPPESPMINLPDLVLLDPIESEILNIEGEKTINVQAGIDQIATFGFFESDYIAKAFPGYQILRSVVLFGGSGGTIDRVEVSLLVNSAGKVVLGICAPTLMKRSIENWLAYWASPT